MKAMKILGALVFILGFTQCKSTKFDNNPPFKVEKSSYNNWVGGQPGVSGTRVEIYLNDKVDVTFESLFFKNKKTNIEVREKDGKTFLTAHYDTSKSKDLILDEDVKKEAVNKLPEDFPFELKDNEAVLSFKEGSKTKYVKIDNVNKTKSDFYPKMNKQ